MRIRRPGCSHKKDSFLKFSSWASYRGPPLKVVGERQELRRSSLATHATLGQNACHCQSQKSQNYNPLDHDSTRLVSGTVARVIKECFGAAGLFAISSKLVGEPDHASGLEKNCNSTQITPGEKGIENFSQVGKPLELGQPTLCVATSRSVPSLLDQVSHCL